MRRLLRVAIKIAVVLALAQSTAAQAQLMIQSQCNASQSNCAILIGPPGNAATVYVPLVNPVQSPLQDRQLRCTQIENQGTWPSRPPMRQCRMWE